MYISQQINHKIKNLIKLQKKSKLCIKHNLIIVEGIREIKQALHGGFSPKELFLCKDFFQDRFLLTHFPIITEINRHTFSKIVYRKKSGGVLGIFYRRNIYLPNLKISQTPLLLILNDIEKPGNLGAILRNAAACSVDGVILCNCKTDIFHANVIRASIGTVFTQKIIITNTLELLHWLKMKNIKLIASVLQDSAISLYDINLCSGIAIIMGSESSGVSKDLIQASNMLLKIPLDGNVDSLNVSNATAIILFEALRQRKKLHSINS